MAVVGRLSVFDSLLVTQIVMCKASDNAVHCLMFGQLIYILMVTHRRLSSRIETCRVYSKTKQ